MDKIIIYPKTEGLDKVIRKFAEDYPDLNALAHPRRYPPPYGYMNPKYYSLILECFYVANEYFNVNDKAAMWCSMIAKSMLEDGVPTYFVDRDFLKAVVSDELPDCRVMDINWPLKSILFVLPIDFMRSYLGGYTFPFISAGLMPKGMYDFRNLNITSVDLPTTIENPADKFIFHYPYYFASQHSGGALPLDYAASFAVTMPVSELVKVNDFVDYVDPRDTRFLPEVEKDLTKVREEEIRVNNLLNAITVKLLSATGNATGYIQKGTRQWPKNPPKPGQKLGRPEIYSPNFIGRSSSVQSASRGPSIPTGRQVPPHWRRRHYQWTPLGAKEKVYSIDNMPKILQPGLHYGKIDWNACTPEQIDRFKATHRQDLIGWIRVNQELEAKSSV
jgi:hypothetical protein